MFKTKDPAGSRSMGGRFIEFAPWEIDLGLRYRFRLQKKIYTRIFTSGTYVRASLKPSDYKASSINQQGDYEWLVYNFKFNQLSRNNYMFKVSVGFEYQFANQSKLALDVLHAIGFRDMYAMDAEEFNFTGTDYDFNITSNGTYTSLQSSYEFNLSRRNQ
jgi:hypothetical protein